MNKNVIEIEGLYKKYKLGVVSADTLADDISLNWGKLISKFKFLNSKIEDKKSFNLENQEIFALKNINFNVEKGEILGLIGSNGAGKSTLLKILSKITTPTSGSIKIKGRIASLLEVGTGFHPELSGKENIYLNGAILGMRKLEIDKKLDQIIDFSGVEEFINTPVKRFSSGMRVRLAFSVAAHLDPEILLIDEVLAVGDADFQKKCLDKMENISTSGRTVIFVSHNMSAIRSLCKRAIVLEKGEVKHNDIASVAVDLYLNSSSHKIKSEYKWNLENAAGSDKLRIISVYIKPKIGNLITVNSGISFTIECLTNLKKASVSIGYSIYSNDGIMLTHSYKPISEPKMLEPGFYKTTSVFPSEILNKGIYYIIVWYGESDVENLATTKERIFFEVHAGTKKNSTREITGILNPDISFLTSYRKK